MSLTVGPVPDGWYECRADECRANGIEVSTNEYGTPISLHHCEAGDHPYTVCPPSPNEGPNCLVGNCVSYDPACDASVFFAPTDPELIEP